MQARRVGRIARVPAPHRHGDRKSGIETGGEHTPVALAHPGGAERELAEPISFPRVGAGDVDRQVGARPCKSRGKRRFERLEVRPVGGAVREGNVEVGGLLAEREVLRAVDRVGEDRGVVVEDRGGTVSLVHVAVDHDDPCRESVALKDPRRHGGVVEDAVALPPLPERVVRPPGKVDRHAVLQRRLAGGDRSPDRTPGALGERDRPGKSDPAPGGGGKRPVEREAHVLGIVGEGEAGVVGGDGDLDRAGPGGSGVVDESAQQAVFRFREAVTFREGEAEPVGGEDSHREAGE